MVLGTPAAWLLATRSFPGRSVAITLVELPLVVPPAVAGIGLLAALGPEGLLGGTLEAAGVELVFQTAGVVVALVFVASPFYIRQALAAFGALDPAVIEASRTLGAGDGRTFLRVALPGARAGLVAGGALAWGRALGEFGATLVFAGSLERRDPDRAAGHLRALLGRLHRRAGAVGGAGGRQRRDPAGGQAGRRRTGARAMLELDVATRLGDVELDARLARGRGRVPGAGRALGRGQELAAARRGGPAAPRPRAGALRRAHLAGHGGAASTWRPSGAGWASCSRTTRCSGT